MPRRTLSASVLIVCGTLGSLVASASCTLTSPLSMLTDLIKPNDTMSRLKPGYFTLRNAASTSVSERGIKASQTYARWKASKDGLLKVTSDKRWPPRMTLLMELVALCVAAAIHIVRLRRSCRIDASCIFSRRNSCAPLRVPAAPLRLSSSVRNAMFIVSSPKRRHGSAGATCSTLANIIEFHQGHARGVILATHNRRVSTGG